jgi:hypothetical protein
VDGGKEVLVRVCAGNSPKREELTDRRAKGDVTRVDTTFSRVDNCFSLK